jgi:hypothetical protein
MVYYGSTPEDKKRLFQYLGREVGVGELHWEMIRLLMMSPANGVIIPMQDILGLSEEARMNTPATLTGNWEWKLLPDLVTPSMAKSLRCDGDLWAVLLSSCFIAYFVVSSNAPRRTICRLRRSSSTLDLL